MNIELRVNGNIVYVADAPSDEQWKWQDRYYQCVRLMERLSKTEGVPQPIRDYLPLWLEALDKGTLPPNFPT